MLLERLNQLGPPLPVTCEFTIQSYVDVCGLWPLSFVFGPHDYLYARWRFATDSFGDILLYVAQRPGPPILPPGYTIGTQAAYVAVRRELLRTSVLPYVYLGITTHNRWPASQLRIVPLDRLDATTLWLVPSTGPFG